MLYVSAKVEDAIYESKELRAGGEGNCNLGIWLLYIDVKALRHRLSSYRNSRNGRVPG
jgi:hypothetical protein